jgi:hypothetical protein
MVLQTSGQQLKLQPYVAREAIAEYHDTPMIFWRTSFKVRGSAFRISVDN